MPTQQESNHKAERREPRRMTFTDLDLNRLREEDKQFLVWDEPTIGKRKTAIGQLGLSVLVSPGGTKRFRATYYLNGKAVSKKLGKVGEMSLGTARKLTADLRAMADEGKDPKEEARKAKLKEAQKKTFGEIADLFIETDAKRGQRTWDQTHRVLTKNCAAWLEKPIGEITRTDAYELLEGFIAEGRPAKARITYVWLKTMWRWAYKRGHVSEPLMDAVDIRIPKKTANPFRDLHHKEQRSKKIDDDVKTVWKAAEKMLPVESAYIKLLVLLAPRKTALANMRASHLDCTNWIWTVPKEETKGFRLDNPDAGKPYITPLPPLAQRIVRPLLPKEDADNDLIFPGRGGVPLSASGPLMRKLVKAGAPTSFNYHAVRHYVGTWFEDQGHDDYDLKLVLNHVRGSGATPGYRHGYPIDRKLELLEKWADHVESLVMPKGVKALR